MMNPARKVIPRSQLAALEDATAIVSAAHAQARKIIGDAAAAYEAQRRRGYADGVDAARREQAAQVFESLWRNVDFLENSEARIIDLVMQAVRKVIDGFEGRDLTLAAVRKVLTMARDQKQVTLRLGPDQAQALREEIASILGDYPGIGCLDVIPDPRLTDGGCILESPIGIVEATTEIQLAAIRQAFEKTLGHQPQTP